MVFFSYGCFLFQQQLYEACLKGSRDEISKLFQNGNDTSTYFQVIFSSKTSILARVGLILTRKHVTAKLISAFVFAIRIVQSLYYLKPKFQASNHLLCLYSPVYVGPGRKPERWFSHDAAPVIFEQVNLPKPGNGTCTKTFWVRPAGPAIISLRLPMELFLHPFATYHWSWLKQMAKQYMH